MVQALLHQKFFQTGLDRLQLAEDGALTDVEHIGDVTDAIGAVVSAHENEGPTLGQRAQILAQKTADLEHGIVVFDGIVVGNVMIQLLQGYRHLGRDALGGSVIAQLVDGDVAHNA